jgi:hypothetical protein
LVIGFGIMTTPYSGVRAKPLGKKTMKKSRHNIMYFLFQILLMCNLGIYCAELYYKSPFLSKKLEQFNSGQN